MPRRDYQAKLNADNSAVLERSRNARDVAGDYPPPGDLEMRAACERNLRLFSETYFPNAFKLAWSPDHLKVIARMEEVILNGGLFALAMPRGAGKTTITVRAAIWALFYGHRRFLSLIGATEGKAKELMKQFKSELLFNDRLKADFRQICYPIERLENNGRKAIGQLFDGERTNIEWGADRLTFPTMPDEACDGVNVSGYTISVGGLTGALRGQSHTLPSGVIIRPEVVILDDPQTRESAMSTSQSENREAIINGDVLGMAGPGQKIAAIMPCTVVRSGDMADEMLDRKKNPEWSGQLTKMVYAFPKAEKLWDTYCDIRRESFQAERGGVEATEFYRENREAMDEGAVVSWPERFNHDEISAIQHAMNLKFRDEATFFAEYNNSPLTPDVCDDDITSDQVASKLNRFARGVVPLDCNKITGFIDIHEHVLYWTVIAWRDDFTGHILDYGTFPDQKRAYFTLRDATIRLESLYPNMGVEGRIHAGLTVLADAILGREWERDDGAAMKVERCLIDANWGPQTDTIYQFCRQSAHSAIVTPSHGKYVGAASVPMRDYRTMPGDKSGLNWRMPNLRNRRSVRHVFFDTNFWKSFTHARLLTAMGDRGCLSIFGDKPSLHRLFADHTTAEFRTKTEGQGRKLDEWKMRPGRADNHWLDCLVGACVAASIQGVALSESGGAAAPKKERVSFSEMQKKKRA